MYAERASRLPGAVVWSRTIEASTAGPVHPVLPDGCMDLLWNEGRLLVAGPDTRAYVPGTAPAQWAGIRFGPGTAPTYLGVPAHELRDRRVDLTDLWPAATVRRLTARVSTSPDPVTALEETALERAADVPPPDPLLRHLVAALDTGRPVAATADELGLGARQLHRRSLTAFGYGPKTLQRVLRFHRFVRLLDAAPARADASPSAPPDLAALAAKAGYADQAHLTRECSALSGYTPAALARVRQTRPG